MTAQLEELTAGKSVCRLYRSRDEAGVLALYRDVFNLNFSVEERRWYYEQMPEGDAIVVVAERADRIVGHYAIQPRPFRFNGAKCLSGIAIGTMVHPAARDLKTLVEMAQLCYEQCRARGIEFLYTFSNDAAWRIRQVVLGWKALPQIVEWDGAFVAAKQEATSLREVRTFDARAWRDACGVASVLADEVVERRAAISGRRAPSWLKWRFASKPAADYALLVVAGGDDSEARGYAVLKQYQRGELLYGHILDWRVADDDAFDTNETAEALLAAAWRQFESWDVNRVSCWAQAASSLQNHLAARGLEAAGRKTNFGYLNLSLPDDAALAYPQAWSVSMADSDVY